MSNTFIPQRAMLIFAHPDDIEFSAGGTAALWARHGSHVTYVVITDGNVGSHDEELTAERLAAIRREEQRAAAQVAGAKECIFLGYHDGLLQPTLELRKELVRLIRQYKPTAVVCGDPSVYVASDFYVNHPDHRAAAIAALEAVFPAAEMRLLYPDLLAEGYAPHKVNYVYISNWREGNYFIDVSDTIDVKIEALRQHKSQFNEWDPEESVRQWSKETGQKVGFRYAEAFRRVTLKEIEPEDETRQ
ncbi:MAG: PIG-L deacetylase family protein [Chloroflexota bacterium]